MIAAAKATCVRGSAPDTPAKGRRPLEPKLRESRARLPRQLGGFRANHGCREHGSLLGSARGNAPRFLFPNKA